MKISSVHPIIISDNAEKTVEFYGALGFTTKHSTKTDFGTPVFIIANGDVELEIMEAPKNAPIPMQAGFHGLRINVDDLDAAVEAFQQNGGTVLTGHLDNGYATVVAVKDADGNNITLMQHHKK